MFYYLPFLKRIQTIGYILPAIILAVAFRDFCKAWVYGKLGDHTPKACGRLTLNPLAHLDLIGSCALAVFHVGWSRPMPSNAQNFRHPKWATILALMIGPVANLLLAFLCLLAQGLFLKYGPKNSVFIYHATTFMRYAAQISIGLMLFELLPIPPLDMACMLRELSWRASNFYMMWRKWWWVILLMLVLLALPDGPLDKVIDELLSHMWTLIRNWLDLNPHPKPVGIPV